MKTRGNMEDIYDSLKKEKIEYVKDILLSSLSIFNLDLEQRLMVENSLRTAFPNNS